MIHQSGPISTKASELQGNTISQFVFPENILLSTNAREFSQKFPQRFFLCTIKNAILKTIHFTYQLKKIKTIKCLNFRLACLVFCCLKDLNFRIFLNLYFAHSGHLKRCFVYGRRIYVYDGVFILKKTPFSRRRRKIGAHGKREKLPQSLTVSLNEWIPSVESESSEIKKLFNETR